MIWCTWLLLVNLGMIWCFGFFFLELLDDCDEESQQRCEALASLDDAGRKLGSIPTLPEESKVFETIVLSVTGHSGTGLDTTSG